MEKSKQYENTLAQGAELRHLANKPCIQVLPLPSANLDCGRHLTVKLNPFEVCPPGLFTTAVQVPVSLPSLNW